MSENFNKDHKEFRVYTPPLEPGYLDIIRDSTIRNEQNTDIFQKLEKHAQEIFKLVCFRFGIDLPTGFPKSYLAYANVLQQFTSTSNRVFEVNPRMFDFLESYLNDDSDSHFILGKKVSEVAIVFGAKAIIHEYIHILLSLNQVKLRQSENQSNSSIQSGFNIQKLKTGLDNKILQTETRDVDEGFTEFLAIYFVLITNNIDNTESNFNVFLQGSPYVEQAKKIRDLAILLSNESEKINDEIITLFLNSKKIGSFQPIRKFIKDKFNYVLRSDEIKSLDFSRLQESR